MGFSPPPTHTHTLTHTHPHTHTHTHTHTPTHTHIHTHTHTVSNVTGFILTVLLGAFAQLRKATVSFVMSVRPFETALLLVKFDV
jgi:hypothetical protein